jgi:tetratricopeptide (TPR) repeat protein
MRSTALITRRLAILAAVLLLLGAGAAPAQEKKKKADKPKAEPEEKQTEKSDAGVEMLNRAFELTRTAKTAEDFGEIIKLCEKGTAATADENYSVYGKRLCAWAHLKRGEVLAQANPPDEEQALADFDAAVKLREETDPNNPASWSYFHQRAVSLAMAGRHEDALKDFDRVLALRPNFGKDYFNRGEVHFALGDARKAIEDYNQATRYGYNESTVYARRGFALFTLRDVRQAMTDYNRAISRNGQDYEAFTYRGDAYAKEGLYDYAVRDYQRAITLNDKFGRAHYSLAWLRATCAEPAYRDGQVALRHAKRAIEHGGETFNNLDALAAAQARAGQFAEAAATQKKAITAAPKEEHEGLEKRLAQYEKKEAYVSEEPREQSGKKSKSK